MSKSRKPKSKHRPTNRTKKTLGNSMTMIGKESKPFFQTNKQAQKEEDQEHPIDKYSKHSSGPQELDVIGKKYQKTFQVGALVVGDSSNGKKMEYLQKYINIY
jgi:hypothetical protein